MANRTSIASMDSQGRVTWKRTPQIFEHPNITHLAEGSKSRENLQNGRTVEGIRLSRAPAYVRDLYLEFAANLASSGNGDYAGIVIRLAGDEKARLEKEMEELLRLDEVAKDSNEPGTSQNVNRTETDKQDDDCSREERRREKPLQQDEESKDNDEPGSSRYYDPSETLDTSHAMAAWQFLLNYKHQTGSGESTIDKLTREHDNYEADLSTKKKKRLDEFREKQNLKFQSIWHKNRGMVEHRGMKYFGDPEREALDLSTFPPQVKAKHLCFPVKFLRPIQLSDGDANAAFQTRRDNGDDPDFGCLWKLLLKQEEECLKAKTICNLAIQKYKGPMDTSLWRKYFGEELVSIRKFKTEANLWFQKKNQ